jgi:hypothetical protein
MVKQEQCRYRTHRSTLLRRVSGEYAPTCPAGSGSPDADVDGSGVIVFFTSVDGVAASPPPCRADGLGAAAAEPDAVAAAASAAAAAAAALALGRSFFAGVGRDGAGVVDAGVAALRSSSAAALTVLLRGVGRLRRLAGAAVGVSPAL